MKYEKFDVGGVPWIRITIDENNRVERPMVDADKVLFKDGDVYVSPAAPVPAEPYNNA